MEGYFQELIGTYGYMASFSILLLCGLGLPLPEEVTLIGSGMLVAAGRMEFWPAVLVCSSAILIGDSIPFLLGRRYGLRALRIRWVARLLHPERFARLQKRFKQHGDWATFTLRFLAGIRIPGFFVAGTMGMTYRRFLLLDLLGAVLSVPISIYLGKIFSNSIQELQERMQGTHLILAFIALSLALTLILTMRRKPRNRTASPPATAVAPRPSGLPDTSEVQAAGSTDRTPSQAPAMGTDPSEA